MSSVPISQISVNRLRRAQIISIAGWTDDQEKDFHIIARKAFERAELPSGRTWKRLQGPVKAKFREDIKSSLRESNIPTPTTRDFDRIVQWKVSAFIRTEQKKVIRSASKVATPSRFPLRTPPSSPLAFGVDRHLGLTPQMVDLDISASIPFNWEPSTAFSSRSSSSTNMSSSPYTPSPTSACVSASLDQELIGVPMLSESPCSRLSLPHPQFSSLSVPRRRPTPSPPTAIRASQYTSTAEPPSSYTDVNGYMWTRSKDPLGLPFGPEICPPTQYEDEAQFHGQALLDLRYGSLVYPFAQAEQSAQHQGQLPVSFQGDDDFSSAQFDDMAQSLNHHSSSSCYLPSSQFGEHRNDSTHQSQGHLENDLMFGCTWDV